MCASRLAAALVAAQAIAGCGMEWPYGGSEKPFKAKAKARADGGAQVQTWQGSPQLAANKSAIVAALRQRGASDEQVALGLAMAMQETNDCDACQRDASKDGTAAANYSLWNFNADCLGQLGWSPGSCDLNNQGNLGEAAGYLLKGLTQFGEDSFLNFHRGGRQALQDGTSYGAAGYRAQIRATQAVLMQQRNLWTDNTRVAGIVQHV